MNEILTTKNYGLFKMLNGNRPLNELHVRRLMESFKMEYLLSPVIVNKNMEIIDGQHRLEAAKRLGLPINYIKTNGYGLMEVQLLNTSNKNWGKIEYLNSYCDLGIKSYLQLKEFMNTYPIFGISAAEKIMTNTIGGVNNRGSYRINGKEVGRVKNFEMGKFEVNDIKLSYEYAAKIIEYAPYYSGYFRALFVGTLITLFKNPDFIHNEMIKKLQLHPTALVHCQTSEQYKLLIEKIYNYKNHNKVNLRY